MRVQIIGLMEILVIMAWLAGVVLSKGFWSCLFAIVIPPYAWYLVVEKVMLINGWLQ
jgi:hypothetical protein